MSARRPAAAARSARVGAATLCIALAGPAAHAGRPCEAQPPAVADIERGMALAQATAARLDATGAEVVVLARAGQDLSRYGLAWSHLGFAYRGEAEGTGTGTGRRSVWRVLHKLNACGTASAQLYRQGLGDFFLDAPHRYEAAFAVPTPQVQARLLPLLSDDMRAAGWHTPRYSMVAYPWAQRYQQSNQWAIETLAGAMDDGARDRPRAQAWLQLRGYRPTVLRLGAFTRLGARATAANVAFDDHPDSQRYADRIATVTADSVFTWLQREGLAAPLQTVR